MALRGGYLFTSWSDMDRGEQAHAYTMGPSTGPLPASSAAYMDITFCKTCYSRLQQAICCLLTVSSHDL